MRELSPDGNESVPDHDRNRNSQSSVLYTSGYTDEEAAKQSIVEGGYSFLVKPFTPDTLV